MAIHANPPALIDMTQIQAEFGGTGALSQYYRGGSLVPNTQQNINIPTSGTIRYSDFYGAAKSVLPAQTEALLTSNTSYTFPAGTTPFNFYLNVLGAGGGGGGVGTEQNWGGGGGGGGAGGIVTNYAIPIDASVTPQVVTVNIGAGGLANFSGATAGGDSFVQVNGVEVYRVTGGAAGGNGSPNIVGFAPGAPTGGGAAGIGGSGGSASGAITGGNGTVGDSGGNDGASGNGGRGGDTVYGNGGEGGQAFGTSSAVWDGNTTYVDGVPYSTGPYLLAYGATITVGGNAFGGMESPAGWTGGGGGGGFNNGAYSNNNPYWYGGAGGQGFAIISYPNLNDSLDYETTLQNNATSAINTRTTDEQNNAQNYYLWNYIINNNPNNSGGGSAGG